MLGGVVAVSHCRSLCGAFWSGFRRDLLPVTPWGDFLCEQKVTKESFRRRGFRFPRLLKTSTLEPAKRNRARFPFDSFRGGRWTVLPVREKKLAAEGRHFILSVSLAADSPR